jgi:hypothetical protein
MSDMRLVNRVAVALGAYENCRKCDTESQWKDCWKDRLQDELPNHLPSGSGFDRGTFFDIEASEPKRLVFNTAFHHMNDGGYYDGWTEHSVIVTPCLVHGFTMRITGRDRNGIKEYIAQAMESALNADISWNILPELPTK